jgi:predicted RNase H-like HicB family nuclease
MKTSKKVMVNVNLSVPLMVFKEDSQFIAHSPFLDLSACGKTFEEAESQFEEAATLLIEELIKKGKLDQCLQSLGWKKVRKQWTPPTIVSHINNIEVNVEKVSTTA